SAVDAQKAEGSRSEHQAGHSDKRVSRVNIAAQQKPRDHRAEAPPRESPLVKKVEVAASPSGRKKAHDGHAHEQHDENDERGPVHGGPTRSCPWSSRRRWRSPAR